MTQEELTKLINEFLPYPSEGQHYALRQFAKLVAEKERELISDEWWSCYQSDLENGVKSLNEYEAKKFATTYPELAKFGSWLDARGNS
jgi:hypothetical protein